MIESLSDIGTHRTLLLKQVKGFVFDHGPKLAMSSGAGMNEGMKVVDVAILLLQR